MPRTTAADKNKSSTGGLPAATAPVPATPAPAPATSARTVASGAAPAASNRSHSLAMPSVSATTNPNEPLSPSDYVAQFNGTGDPLLLYTPEGGFTNDDSILKAIDLIEEAPANSYISDAKIARITDKGTLMSIHFQRLRVFQLVVNLVDASQAIVGISPAITAVKENYQRLMNGSLDELFKINGGAVGKLSTHSGTTTTPTNQKLKRPKIVEVPKFDVHKPGMQTFLNSMSLVTKSFSFDSDKDLARYYLNNLTENSKSLIFSIYAQNDPFYESSSAVIKYLESFISSNIGIDATRDIRDLKMGSGSLRAYYNSFTRIVSDLGEYSMSQAQLRVFFIAGLNPNAAHSTNINLHMHTFLGSKPNATITDLYAEAEKVISLTTNVLGKRAGPDRGAPRPQQHWERGNTQRQYQQPPQGQPRSRTTCSICGHYGHPAERCTSSWSVEGKWLGKGPPPSKYVPKSTPFKKTAMVHTPDRRYQTPKGTHPNPPREPPTHQQQPWQKQKHKQPLPPSQKEPRQKSATALPKRKKVAFKAQAVTLADLESDMEWHGSDSDGSYESAYSYRSFDLIGEEDCRLVTSQTENKRRIPVKERLEQPNTYASKLKGPAPGPSAKPLEQPLRFVKRKNNIVKR